MRGAPARPRGSRHTLEPIQLGPRDQDPRQVRSRLLRWAESHGRSFAWRSWRDPYRLLVTEILLRQTKAESVSMVVGRLFEQYPTPVELAGAGDEFEALIKPLGLVQQRAGQLRALGRVLTEIPLASDPRTEDWQRLPGIGPYSAGMVAATLGVRRAVAVDTNIARVVCRVFGLIPTHFEARKSTNVWQKTGELVCGRSTIRALWAILDLAALLCVANNPRCEACPLRTVCVVGQYYRPKIGGLTHVN